MFDWNDQELANIIWGEACESDDHIVPYPEASDDYRDKMDHNQESDTIKPTEQKAPGAKIELHGRELESSSNFETGEGISTSGFGTDSWPDLSLSSFEKTEQHCMDEANQLDKGAELFQNSNEAKEQFVDYGWANIGSFDDLDQIFSNDDTIFSHVSLGNVDELWSSRDATNSPIKAFPATSDSPSSGSGVLRNASEHSEIKTEYVLQDEQAISLGYGKTDYAASHGLQNPPATLHHVEYAGGKSKPMEPMEKDQTGSDMGKSTVTNSYQAAVNYSTPNEIPDKVSRQRKFLRCRRKLEDKSEGKSLQDFYGNWSSTRHPSGKFENQLPGVMVQSSPSPVLGQKRQLQGPESFPYQHVSNQFVSQTMYGTLTNACQATPVLSHIQPGQFKHQNLLSGSDVSLGSANPVNKSADTSKPVTMTTQEKIEKLRRRQQLQALLAIKKQQQQFSHQVSCTNQSSTQKCPQENQIQHPDRADLEVEDLSTLPSLDPNSPIEQDDSNTVSAAVEYYSAEDTILYRLQDIIAKLDLKTRLCIRDSLLRLAQSAVQRHYTSDTSSSNKNSKDEHEVITKEEIDSCNRYTSMPDVETETNPIDRTVAHLLFHRPLDLSGKHSGPPESPVSTKLLCERKTAGLANLSNEVLPDSLKNKQKYPQQDPGSYSPDADPQSAIRVYHNQSTKPLEFIDVCPLVLRPYILDVKDVARDGHCGFRAIASLCNNDEDGWMKVRKNLINELKSNEAHYVQLFGSVQRVNQLHHALNYFGSSCHREHWMTMPDMGHIIASCYNVILIHVSSAQCFTFFPLRTVPISASSPIEIAIGLVEEHFVQVFLKSGHPMPPIPPDLTQKRKNIPPVATDWETTLEQRCTEWASPYIARIDHFKSLQPQVVLQKNPIVIATDSLPSLENMDYFFDYIARDQTRTWSNYNFFD